MKTKVLRIISVLLLILVLLVLGTGIAGAVAKSNLAKKYPAPGQLVDVGGYQMHIDCLGQGSPTVILEAGMGDSSLTWTYVKPDVAKYTRVCSYDRAGYGWSEASPFPRTASKEVEELHTLLAKANIQAPYVLVGHSLGGVNMRVFAHKYPEEVIGLVLVDSAQEKQNRNPVIKKANEEGVRQVRMLVLLNSIGIMALLPDFIPNPGLPDDVYTQLQATEASNGHFKTWLAEMNEAEASYDQVRSMQIGSFGNMPLVVISRGHWDTLPVLSDDENQEIWEVWQELQSELVELSSEAKQIVAKQSGHFIQIDQPDLVIDAIDEVIQTTHQKGFALNMK